MSVALVFVAVITTGSFLSAGAISYGRRHGLPGFF